MGKRQHQKDKLYLTRTEWATLYGGKRPSGPNETPKSGFRRLPFDHCGLSLQPFEHPLCTPEGVVYDLMSIVPFLKKFKIDPATGKKLDAKSLVRLNYFKNVEGKYHCPVLFKVFNENSHIVANKVTGNVFSFEAIEQLNFKSKNLKDLISDEPFTRNDIITIQDPSNLEKFNLSNFHHLKHNLKVTDEEEQKARTDPKYHLKSVSKETHDILDELERDYVVPEKKETATKVKADYLNAAHYSTGSLAASFTSTVMEPITVQEVAILADDVIRYARVKKSGFVRILTNLGPLNLEVFCHMIPKASENFIRHCQNGYYNGTIFHRSIRNFMIQGGDPTGKGTGGESIWGKPFEDHFKPNLIHSGRGILSMANSGKDANKSQFFITYRSCRHLDNKHTVFGKLVGGLEVFNLMEQIEVDKDDRPIEDIKILQTVVFVDPFEEVDQQLAKQRAELEEKKEAKVEKKETAALQIREFKKGIGKYINPNKKANNTEQNIPLEPEPPKKKKIVSGKFGDFSSWQRTLF